MQADVRWLEDSTPLSLPERGQLEFVSQRHRSLKSSRQHASPCRRLPAQRAGVGSGLLEQAETLREGQRPQESRLDEVKAAQRLGLPAPPLLQRRSKRLERPF